MAGTYGSTLVSELNRLANGGTYPAISEYVDMALAAKNWAIAKAITPTKTDTVGILNEIAGITDQENYLDFNGVCNLLAGTTGLPAAAALRELAS
jgi:hypothetical protein